MNQLKCLLGLFLGICSFIGGYAQTIELDLRYCPEKLDFVVLFKTDFTCSSLVLGPSQLSIVMPKEASSKKLTPQSLSGPIWDNNSSVFSPAASPESNFHAFGTTGARIALNSSEWKELFSFKLPNIDCLNEGLRFFDPEIDPLSDEPGMYGGDFDNTLVGFSPNADKPIERISFIKAHPLPAIELIKKPPHAVCSKETIILNLSEDGCYSLDAKTLNLASFDNCTPKEDLKFSFSSNIDDTNKSMCCDYMGLNKVYLYVTDKEGLQSTCSATILLRDLNDFCSEPIIQGTILREDNKVVDEVSMKLIEKSGKILESIFNSEENGQFYFAPANYNEELTISLFKEDSPINGVSTYDLYLLEQHLELINPLPGDLSHISADVNRDGLVDRDDYDEIRNLILGNQYHFSQVEPWRFVYINEDGNYFLPNYKQSLINVPLFNKPLKDMGIIAVKVGDFDLDALPNKSLAHNQEVENVVSLEFLLQSVAMGSDFIDIEFYSSNFEKIKGFQFSLAFDPELLSFFSVKGNEIPLTDSNIGLNYIGDGLITFSWNALTPKTIGSESPLFVLRFKNKEPNIDPLESQFYLKNFPTLTEAYSSKYRLMDINVGHKVLSSTPFVGEGAYHLFQNYPNPFNRVTYIEFFIPFDGYVTFKIFDGSGKIFVVLSEKFKAGKNILQIDQSLLPSSGVYYYQMSVDEFVSTKKMIINY